MQIIRARNRTVREYYLNGEELQEVYCSSYLGIQASWQRLQYTSILRWNAQVEHAAGKASRTLGMLKRNLRVNSVKLKAMAYTSLVRPIMDYGTTAWDPYTNKNIHSWKPSNAVRQDNKKLSENARNCNWTVETAGVWTTTRQKKATETVYVIQDCQRTGGCATQGHRESGTAKNSWKSLLKIWHYESKHWHFKILVFSTYYTGLE